MPVEAVFPPGVTDADRDAQNTAAMVDSQQDAIAAALVELGYDFPRDVTVAGVLDDSPAAGVLEEGDIITEVNGTAVNSVDELRAAVARERRGHPGEPPRRARRRGADDRGHPGRARRLDVVLGVGVRMDYEFPIDVELQLDNVGGPSAGMMFALGIIDKLTPGAHDRRRDRRRHRHDRLGAARSVPIGGIRQKLWGAEDAGADWFLAPASNCDEVVGHVPDGLSVFAVVDPRRGAHDRRGDRRGRRHLAASPPARAA